MGKARRKQLEGEGRTLHGALFSKSTPSLEPGKVYSKGQGSPWRHSFCSLCHAVYVQPWACVSVCNESLRTSPSKYLVSMIFLCVLIQFNGGLVACCVHFTFFSGKKFNDSRPLQKERGQPFCAAKTEESPCLTSIKQQHSPVSLSHRLYTVWFALFFPSTIER